MYESEFDHSSEIFDTHFAREEIAELKSAAFFWETVQVGQL
jgi:hypothetical protein